MFTKNQKDAVATVCDNVATAAIIAMGVDLSTGTELSYFHVIGLFAISALLIILSLFLRGE